MLKQFAMEVAKCLEFKVLCSGGGETFRQHLALSVAIDDTPRASKQDGNVKELNAAYKSLEH